MKVFIQDNFCTIFKLQLNRISQSVEVVDKLEDANICLVGTCAAFYADEARSISMIEQLRAKTKVPIIAYGCMTQVSPELLNVDWKLASWREEELIKMLEGCSNTKALPTTFRSKSDWRNYDPSVVFLGITVGCSFQCTYCPHKLGAGNLTSLPLDILLAQVKSLTNVKTLIITGTDTACYGKDLGIDFKLLLSGILLHFNGNIHIAQFNPAGLDDSVVALMENPRVKDIQLPIQTSSPRLLSLMGRKYPDKLEEYLKRLQAKFLRTDLLAGFPTENVYEFEDSIEFACKYFKEIAVYSFEPKAGTPITMMGFPEIDSLECERRRNHALAVLKLRGLLGHSGGQHITSLYENERTKKSITSRSESV